MALVLVRARSCGCCPWCLTAHCPSSPGRVKKPLPQGRQVLCMLHAGGGHHSQQSWCTASNSPTHPAPHRFAGGVLGAKFSARAMLGWGLIATALVNIAFGFSGASMAALTTLWFINGGLQVRPTRRGWPFALPQRGVAPVPTTLWLIQGGLQVRPTRWGVALCIASARGPPYGGASALTMLWLIHGGLQVRSTCWWGPFALP